LRVGKFLRRKLGAHNVAIKQHDTCLELPGGLEVGIAGRIERLDESYLFDGHNSSTDSDDVFHGTSNDDECCLLALTLTKTDRHRELKTAFGHAHV